MKIQWKKGEITFVLKQYAKGYSRDEITRMFRSKYGIKRSRDSIKHCIESYGTEVVKVPPKVLVLDIETRSLTVKTFGLKDQNIGLEQVIDDGGILCVASKWLGEKEIFYKDVKGDKKKEKQILKHIWKLMNEADVILGQNSNQFDIKVLIALFIIHDMGLPKYFHKLDTLVMSRKLGKFMSHKLAYMSEKLCAVRKSVHKKYPGFSLWTECEKGNLDAWQEMEKYNKVDVLATEELFVKLAAYDRSELVQAALKTYHANKNKK